MSVLPYLDRILTELRQFLELGTVATILMRSRSPSPDTPRGWGRHYPDQTVAFHGASLRNLS